MNENGPISNDFGKQIAETLSEESDRACVILVTSWADHYLKSKLVQEFNRGNAKARSDIFSSNGPFSTFSGKLNVAFCAGWIDSDVYRDLHVIRKMRNKFAHSIECYSLHDEPFPAMVAKLCTPKREYHDWGKLCAWAADSGVVLSTDGPPADAGEQLDLSKFTFRAGASVLIAVLVANLGIPVTVRGCAEPVAIRLPKHMRGIQR